MGYNKYKDLNPADTIKKAKKVLSSVGMNMKETMLKSANNLYSVRLQNEDLNWGVNGKGTSKQYSKASAYGEAMERIQNLSFIDILLNNSYSQSCNCKLFAESQVKNLNEILLNFPEIKNDMISSFYNVENKKPSNEDLLKIWGKLNGSKKFETIQFYSVKKKKIVYLPIYIITELSHSNGLCSGNTPEEALCQGLSEILERYVQEIVFSEKLTPPEIPNEYILKYCPELLETISEIERKGNFKVLVFDCSLGKSFPVVCVALIDQDTHGYRIKFGAHPQFAIALERCLTELAQGRKFDKNHPFTSWIQKNQNNWNTRYNWSSIMQRNIGSVPNSFFYNKPSWKFKKWENQNNFNNKKGTSQLIEKCLSISSDVYIRDNSYLGFNAYCIYVPKISVVNKVETVGKNAYIEKKLWNICNKLNLYANSLTIETKKQLIKFLSHDHKNIEFKMKENIILASLYLDTGDIKSAINELYKENKPTAYIKCLIRELELRKDGVNVCDRDNVLKMFFDKKTCLYVTMNWRNKNTLPLLFNPFNMKNNVIKNLYKIENNKILKKLCIMHNNLKKFMVNNPINQQNLESILK